MGKEELSHPSFGTISFNRVVVSGTNFYGNETPQNHFVTLEICTSVTEKDIKTEKFYPKDKLIKVRMTNLQFVELITSMNVYNGIPCTIEAINGEKVEPLPKIENRKEFVHRKFQDRMKEFSKSIRDRQIKAKELVKKKTLTKDEMNSLQHHIEWLTTEVESNIPFFAKCFQETMDEVVFEAKLEVENAIQHKIAVLGLESLNQLKELKRKRIC